MSVTKLRIKDGVNLNIIETDKFKTNYISVNFMVKLDRETAAMNALLPRVLKRGTQSYPDMSTLSRRLEYLYATNISPKYFKRGEIQVFGLDAYVLDNSYALGGEDIMGGVLDMMDEIIFNPKLVDGLFDADYVESEKRNLIDDINAKINNKISYAISRCQEEMCRDELFSVPASGGVEDVEKITAASLYEHYKKILNCAQIEVYYVGCGNDAIAPRLEKMFASVEHIDTASLETSVIREATDVREVVDDEPVKQGKLSLGFRTGKVLADGDYHKFSLFCEIFGNSPTSRLFVNVREKLSLCYYCRSIPEAQKGIMIVASGIENANRQKAQDEILLQLEAMKNGDFTDEDFESAKRSLNNGYREIYDTPTSLEAWYMGRGLAGLDTSPDDAAALIKAATREDVIEAAKSITLDTVYFMRGALDEVESDGGESDDE